MSERIIMWLYDRNWPSRSRGRVHAWIVGYGDFRVCGRRNPLHWVRPHAESYKRGEDCAVRRATPTNNQEAEQA